ncbi:MAG TPA: Lpg1974 family pore-forming outer membrane protein [Gemmataceae bacterium]|nr:Lpg1974 family pore-forming outer membrane protein [Gemmataceae bacterium]
MPIKVPNHTREPRGEWSISAGILFLQPVFDSNPAFIVSSAGGNVTRQVDFHSQWNAAPMVWLGYTSERGWGVRGRWFLFSNEVSESTGIAAGETIRGASPLPLGQIPVAGAATANSHLYVNVFDLQGTCTWESAYWTHVVGFGARYTHMSQDYRAAFAGPGTRIDLSADHNFNGGGPTLSFQTRRCLGESGFSLYGQALGAINFGTSSDGYVAVNNGMPQLFTHNRTLVLPVGELEVGAEYAHTLGPARLFVQAGFAGQVWWNGGSATNLSGFGSTNSSNSNFGFLGIALRAGIRY